MVRTVRMAFFVVVVTNGITGAALTWQRLLSYKQYQKSDTEYICHHYSDNQEDSRNVKLGNLKGLKNIMEAIDKVYSEVIKYMEREYV